MKKILSFILTFVILLAIVPFSVSAAGPITLSIDNGNGESTIYAEAGRVAKVYVKVFGTSALSGAKVTVNYDTKLELAYVNNGMRLPNGTDGAVAYFNEMSSSAIYGAHFGGVNGTYVFNASHDMKNGNANVLKSQGYFVTLSFKVPDDAKVGDEYSVSINKDLSRLVMMDNIKTQNLEFETVSGKIVVVDGQECDDHLMKTTLVSTASYTTKGFLYSECTLCHAIEIEKEDAYAVNVFGYEGVSIRYAANPVGIAATFTIADEDFLQELTLYGCTYEIGTIAICNGKKIQAVYYGEGSTHEMKDNKFFSIVTEGSEKDEVSIIQSWDKVTFCAYIKITDRNKNERTVELYATLDGEEEISIFDVVSRINLKNYPSESSQKYLNNVLAGF